MPTLLTKDAIDIGGDDDETDYPHPRKRINEVFADGDKCVLLLKDRGKLFKTSAEEQWYEQAYGKKRNMMKYRMQLQIPEDVKFNIKLLYFAEVTYDMFPEHKQEFLKMQFESKFMVPLQELDSNYYETEIDLPFGTVSSVLKYREEGAEDDKYHDVTVEKIKKAYDFFQEPIPISMAEQSQKDKLEEEENKKREQEARAA